MLMFAFPPFFIGMGTKPEKAAIAHGEKYHLYVKLPQMKPQFYHLLGA